MWYIYIYIYIYIYTYIHTHTHTHTHVYDGILFGAKKKKEILSYTTTWTKLEDIMLSEISQSQMTNTA